MPSKLNPGYNIPRNMPALKYVAGIAGPRKKAGSQCWCSCFGSVFVHWNYTVLAGMRLWYDGGRCCSRNSLRADQCQEFWRAHLHISPSRCTMLQSFISTPRILSRPHGLTATIDTNITTIIDGTMSKALLMTSSRPSPTLFLRTLLVLPTSTRLAAFSVLQRPPPNYPGHVPLTSLERIGLAFGSALASLTNHHRHDMVAALGEATSQPYFISRLRSSMLSHPTGRRILRLKPRITSTTLSMTHLRSLPTNTVGHAYAAWLDREGVTPDTRDSVRYIDDPEEAYVMQRYRESHDFYHAVTGLPVFAEGEIALKAFEFANTGLPMTGLSLFAIAKLKRGERRRFWGTYGPWAVGNGLKCEEVINVFWEEELETDVGELRKRLGIESPPDLRETRKIERDRRRLEKASRETRERVGEGIMTN